LVVVVAGPAKISAVLAVRAVAEPVAETRQVLQEQPVAAVAVAVAVETLRQVVVTADRVL
jgi:hypothetical protein